MANRLEKTLTRKVGPLPLWGWAVAGLVIAWFVFFRTGGASAASQTTGVPVTASTAGVGSDAQQPASGGGSAAGSLSDALIAALAQNTQAADDLLRAVQQQSGTRDQVAETSAVTAPTVNNAPVVTQANAYDPAQAAAAAALGVSAQPNMSLDQLNAQLVAQGRPPQSYPAVIQPAPPPAAIGGPSQVAPPVPFGGNNPVSAPTPIVVQPAPVTMPGGRTVIQTPKAF